MEHRLKIDKSNPMIGTFSKMKVENPVISDSQAMLCPMKSETLSERIRLRQN